MIAFRWLMKRTADVRGVTYIKGDTENGKGSYVELLEGENTQNDIKLRYYHESTNMIKHTCVQ